jgi:hypothetical protein
MQARDKGGATSKEGADFMSDSMVRAGSEAEDASGRMVRRSGDIGGIALAAAAEADVKARFVLAKANPRSEDDAGIRILRACQRPKFAAPPKPGRQVATYDVPVGGGKRATGLSVHAAREFRRIWGNIDTSITMVFDDDDKEVWRVATTDLETNFRRSIDVQVPKAVERQSPKKDDVILRSRTNSEGRPVYLIRAEGEELKANRARAIAIAERETILALLPIDLKEDAIEQIQKTQRDEDAKDPAAAKKVILDAFAEIGVLPRALEEQYLRHPLDQVTPAELGELRGIYAALRSGDLTSFAAACAAKWEDEEVTPEAAKAKSAIAAAQEKIRAKVRGKPPAAEPEERQPGED